MTSSTIDIFFEITKFSKILSKFTFISNILSKFDKFFEIFRKKGQFRNYFRKFCNFENSVMVDEVNIILTRIQSNLIFRPLQFTLRFQGTLLKSYCATSTENDISRIDKTERHASNKNHIRTLNVILWYDTKVETERERVTTYKNCIIANERSLSLDLDGDGGIAAPKKYCPMILPFQKGWVNFLPFFFLCSKRVACWLNQRTFLTLLGELNFKLCESGLQRLTKVAL